MPVNSTVKAFLICDFSKVNNNVKLKGADIDKTHYHFSALTI